jgi:hypothetical protein
VIGLCLFFLLCLAGIAVNIVSALHTAREEREFERKHGRFETRLYETRRDDDYGY